MEEFLQTYGYLALAAGTFLEGETSILVASSLVHSGIFKGYYTVLFAFFGSFANDWLYYMIGRVNGKYFIERRPGLKRRMEPVERFFQSHRLQILCTYRFLYGFRIILPLMIGLSGVRPLQFLGYSVAAGLIWATTVSSLGYLAGEFFELTAKSFEENGLYVVVSFGSLGLLIGYFVKRFAEKRMGIPHQVG